jgi:hypothetical protein
MRSEGPRRMRPGLPRRGGAGAGEYFILLLGLCLVRASGGKVTACLKTERIGNGRRGLGRRPAPAAACLSDSER